MSTERLQRTQLGRRSLSLGFTLVEILVGAAIGLIGMVIILQVFSLSESRKRTTTSGADAQTSGNIALYLIGRDLMQAGYGLTRTTIGCTVNTSYGGDLADPGPFTLAPVSIVDGGVNGAGEALSDSITLLYSTATMGTIVNLLVAPHTQTATTASMRTNFGIGTFSMLVFWESGKQCTLAQVTAIPTNATDITHAASSAWNNTAIYPAAGYNTGATVLNMGGMALRTYSVDATNYNLQLLETNANTGGASTTTQVTGEIVNLQAQYGNDANGNGIIESTEWNTTTPAGGNGGATSTAWSRILLLRLAVLARSGQYEKPATAGGACDATTVAPSWSGGTMAVPGGLPSCYRYKVFETVVPLRNIIWGS